MKKSIFYSATFLFILALSSCDKETDVPLTPVPDKYESGVFFVNEGNYQHGNGSISYYNTNSNSLTQEIFQLENNRSLGDVVQSMKIINYYGYICVNNSNKIEVVSFADFKEQGTIYNLPSVRYFENDYSEYGYATCWGNGGQVKIIYLPTLSVIDSVMVGNGPEGMIILDQKLFVANGGNIEADSTISVISLETHEIIQTINVGYSPKHFVQDQNSNLWVICAGTGSWTSIGEKPSKLVQIDPVSFNVLQEIDLFEQLHPGNIGIDLTGTVVVVGGGFGMDGLYKVFLNHPETPTDIAIPGNFYGFSVNPMNGDIYAADAGDFSSKGSMERYTFLGGKIGEYETGINPNGVSFNWPIMIIN